MMQLGDNRSKKDTVRNIVSDARGLGNSNVRKCVPKLYSQICVRSGAHRHVSYPISVLSLCIAALAIPTASAQPITTGFGARSATQWIVDTNLDGTPDLRKNFGDPNDVPVPADYDGTNGADLAVVRRHGDQLEWILDLDHNGLADTRQVFGMASDQESPADFNGDGQTDLAVVRDLSGQNEWIIDTDRNGTADLRQVFGSSTDETKPGDYNSDGAADFGVVRTVGEQLEWIVDTDRDGSANVRTMFGAASDRTLSADFNGDGALDFAVTRTVENQQEWIIDVDHDGVADQRVRFGKPSDVANPADIDGDGRADLVLLRQLDGQKEWIVDFDRDGTADFRTPFGNPTDTPTLRDFNGDGKVDLAVIRDVSYLHGASWPDIESSVDTLILDHLRDNRIPGATIAISKNGRLVLEKGYGFRNMDERSPMEEFHRTRVGSVSKVLTALAAMRLTEKDSDFSINSTLYNPSGVLSNPAFQSAINTNIANAEEPHPLAWFSRLKVVHLMSHSAGFGGSDERAAAVELGKAVADLEYDEVHEHFLRTRLLKFEPGTTSAYSNHHIGTLGHVLEQVTGQKYSDFVTKEILEPVGLNQVQLEDGQVDGRESFPHLYTPFRANFARHSDVPQPRDYNADGKVDLAVLRPVEGQWEWIIDTNLDEQADIRQRFGKSSDSAAPADYNGDGAVDLAVLRQSNGKLEWLVDTNLDGQAEIRQLFGVAEDIDTVAPADYNGDGVADFAVLRTVGGELEWIVDTNRDGAVDFRESFGKHTDIAIPSDYNGDGTVDFAVARVINNKWEWILDTNLDGVADDRIQFGNSSDRLLHADVDGDGSQDFVVLREDQGQWQWIVDTDRDGDADIRTNFGSKFDNPVHAADYNGDGKVDRTVLRDVDGRLQWIVDIGTGVGIYDASPNVLGFAAGGWTVAAGDLVRLMCATDKLSNHPDLLDAATIDLMETPPFQTFSNRTLGWSRRKSNGALLHTGSTLGGWAAITKYVPGSTLQGLDVGGINVAVAFNIQNGGSNWQKLLDELALISAKAEIDSSFDLF